MEKDLYYRADCFSSSVFYLFMSFYVFNLTYKCMCTCQFIQKAFAQIDMHGKISNKVRSLMTKCGAT